MHLGIKNFIGGPTGTLFGDGTYSGNIIQGGSVLQLQDYTLMGDDVVPAMSGFTSGEWTIDASTTYDPVNRPAWAAFNNGGAQSVNGPGSWAASVSTGWLRASAGSAKGIGGYAITYCSDAGNYHPTAWQFQGSNDGSTWDTLDTKSGQSFSLSERKQFTLSAPASYKQYRLNVTASAGAYLIFSELEILAGTPMQNAIVVTGAATVAPDSGTLCAFAMGNTLVLDGATASVTPTTASRGLFLAFKKIVHVNGSKLKMTGYGYPGQVTDNPTLYSLIPPALAKKFKKSVLNSYVLSQDGALGGAGATVSAVAGTGQSGVGKTGGGGGGGCDDYTPTTYGGAGKKGSCFFGGPAGGGACSQGEAAQYGRDAVDYGAGGRSGSGTTAAWGGGGGAGVPAGAAAPASNGIGQQPGSTGSSGLLVVLAEDLSGDTASAIENKGVNGGACNTSGYAGAGGATGGGLTYVLTKTDNFAGTITCAGGLKGTTGATRSKAAGDGGVGSIIRTSGLG